MQKTPTSPLRRMIPGLIFGFLVLIGLALMGDLRQVSERMLTFRWEFYPLVLGFTLLNYALRFVKWHYYLGQIGAGGLPWSESLRLFIAGFPLAVTPGKVGEALKAVWVKQATGLAVGKGISVVLAERISDGLAVLILSTLGVIAFPRYWPAFLIILLFTIGLIILSQIRPVALKLLAFGQHLPLISRFAKGMGEFYEGSYVLFRPVPTFFAVGLGTISWLGEGIGFYLILIGLGLPPGEHLFSNAVFVMAFSTVIGAASALPGGLGAAEASIAGMLAFILGIEASNATTATLLIRLATLWFGVILGLLTWVLSKKLFAIGGENGTQVEG
jgi:glycosyltransferase 2 family protein